MIPVFDDKTTDDASAPRRVVAVTLAVAAALVVCVAATWPRWHASPAVTPPAQTAPATGSTAITALSTSAPEVASEPTAPNPAPATPTKILASPLAAASAPSVAASASSAPLPASSAASTKSTVVAPQAASVVAPTLAATPVITEDPGNWNKLTAAQRLILAPFQAQWDHFGVAQKRKWLAIASVFPRMSPDAQQRLHERMVRWTQMTPEERRIARENYEMSRVLPPSARAQAWRAYEALPAAQKEKLAAAEKIHRRQLVVSAPPLSHPGPHERRGLQKPGLSGKAADAGANASGATAIPGSADNGRPGAPAASGRTGPGAAEANRGNAGNPSNPSTAAGASKRPVQQNGPADDDDDVKP